jgi:hypothetical protein
MVSRKKTGGRPARTASIEGRRRARSTGRRRRRRIVTGTKLLLVLGAVVLGASPFLLRQFGGPRSHPDPRPDVSAEMLLPGSHFSHTPAVAAVYLQAAEIPHVLDGLYCYCHCDRHAGHHSLLDCFRDEHARSCGVCLAEAVLAHRLVGEGQSLPEIRAAVDDAFR